MAAAALIGSSASAGNLTAGNIVVVRVGTGAAALTNASTAVFLDEYTTSGTLVQTIALPTAASGSNAPLTNSGSATSEGFLTTSTNGQYLIQAGYGIAPGTTSVVSTLSTNTPRVIARIALDGTIDTTTKLSDAYSGNNIRSAFTTNGTDFWTGGTATTGGGVRYATLGGTTSTQVSSTITNIRVVGVQGGQLYCSSATGAFQGISTVGTGIPTTSGQTISLLPGFPTTSGPGSYDHWFANATTLYVADDRTVALGGGLQKWSFNGTTWTLAYTLNSGLTGGLRGLAPVPASNPPALFATSSDNKLVSIVDGGASSAFSTVLTGATNTALRGVRVVPTPCTLEITAQPSSLSLCAGTPAAFSVAATGANLSYSWRKDNVPLANGAGISGADTANLSIAAVSAGDLGNYTCVVANTCGSTTSNSASLSFDVTDTDQDGVTDCNDGCPNDPSKSAPGICGCGVSDTDSDNDGTPNCNDGCPNDPLKTAAGACGCGVSDTDSDGDGTADCNDGCPNDPLKTVSGQCGCGFPETDTDFDGTADCADLCPNDPLKIAPGDCGCGVTDDDTDGDATADCNDGCPNDPAKTAAGACGCGYADADSNLDGVVDCLQATISEIYTNVPGTDNGQEFIEIRGVQGASLAGWWLLALDGDDLSGGVVDIRYDLGALSVGSNGLVLLRDSAAAINPPAAAGTTVAVLDFAPDIENGTNTYILGFGSAPALAADLDSNNDGTLNAGAFSGFTVVDAVTLTENDGPNNHAYADDVGGTVIPAEAGFNADALVRTYDASGSTCIWVGGDVLGTNPGGPYSFDATRFFGFNLHGVNLSATPVVLTPGSANPLFDADADGQANACDTCTDTDGDGQGDPGYPANTCPLDPCPTDAANTDTDLDGTPDCTDGCPGDPLKTAPGVCGCGVADTDTDADGTADCNDGCPADPLKTAPGLCGCGVADTDTDSDGTADCNDLCPNDPLKTAPGTCGCGVAETDSDGDGTADCNDGCPNDPTKTIPGICGCGVSDVDSDSDGVANCNDGCPNDVNKTAPGQCGCGVLDTDTDLDGIANCIDNCPQFANVGQLDTDNDGVGDDCDNCVNLANQNQADCDVDGVGDACELFAGEPDCNFNKVPDACDVLSGASLDVNTTGVPDECETSGGTPYCFGNTGCPCGNNSLAGGCRNSTGLGAFLFGSGTSSVANDSFTLSAGGLPQPAFNQRSFALFLQGTTKQSTPFADGKTCVGGTTVRVATLSPFQGAAVYPLGVNPRISVVGSIPTTGGARYYQVWYRNTAGPCGTGSNLTNGVAVIWIP